MTLAQKGEYNVNFSEAHDYLDSLQFHKIKLGLDSMEAFLEKVGRPEKKLKFIHVAGTNGKGSVCATILTLLASSGYRVGLYTSPHLSSVRERFRINDSYITEGDFARIASRIRRVLGSEMITYFEFTTALALLWFAESDLDVVILETGLGGRLDATNVIVPLVYVITNVSMDHEAYLGNDLASVAFEKAGIIKREVPVVAGTENDISRRIVAEKCQELQAPLFQLGEAFTVSDDEKGTWTWKGVASVFEECTYPLLRCAMKGHYQHTNASLALAVICLLKDDFPVPAESLPMSLLSVEWPGRLEHILLDRQTRKPLLSPEEGSGPLRFLIDGAHNPAGVTSLVNTLKNEYNYGSLIVVWGAMVDKDLSKTLPLIADMSTSMILTQPEGERSANPKHLFEFLPQESCNKAVLVTDVEAAVALAEKQAGPEDLILIAGSLYLIGAVRTLLVGELVE